MVTINDMKQPNDRKPVFRAVLYVAQIIGTNLFVSTCESTTIPDASATPGSRRANRQIGTIQDPSDNGEYCLTEACADAASIIRKNMDPSIDPCEDFYRYACGGFINATSDDVPNNSVFRHIQEDIQKRLTMSLNAAIEPNEPRTFKIVKNYYKSCMDKASTEKRGVQPLQDHLQKFGGWPVVVGDSWNGDDFEWPNLMHDFRRAGYSDEMFLRVFVEIDLKNSTRWVVYVDEPDGFLRAQVMQGLKGRFMSVYYTFMQRVAVLLGADKDRAEKELKEVVNFEVELTNISLPFERRRNHTELYNPMTLKELTEDYPSIPWREYFRKLLPSTISLDENEAVIVKVPSYISKLVELISRTPKRTVANYAISTVVRDSVHRLGEKIKNLRSKHRAPVNENSDLEARSEECTNTVTQELMIATSALYLNKYFGEESKKSVVKIVTDVREQFMKSLKQAQWMDEQTHKLALEKAAGMVDEIGFPDEFLDLEKIDEFHKNLDVSEDNFYENWLNVQRFSAGQLFGRLREPVSESAWSRGLMPVEVNADYDKSRNTFVLPAGILQDVFFNKDRPSYMDYGAIGFVVGHLMFGAFDDQGSQYDKNGNLVDWWTPSAREKYLERVQCIIDQYGNYTIPGIGTKLDGVKSQTQNVADVGGIKVAYDAFKNWLAKSGPEKKLPRIDRSPEQMFWISAANVWCSKLSPEEFSMTFSTGAYSPDEIRVLGSFSDMPEFAEDFMCPEGSKMNPKKKCDIW